MHHSGVKCQSNTYTKLFLTAISEFIFFQYERNICAIQMSSFSSTAKHVEKIQLRMRYLNDSTQTDVYECQDMHLIHDESWHKIATFFMKNILTLVVRGLGSHEIRSISSLMMPWQQGSPVIVSDNFDHLHSIMLYLPGEEFDHSEPLYYREIIQNVDMYLLFSKQIQYGNG